MVLLRSPPASPGWLLGAPRAVGRHGLWVGLQRAAPRCLPSHMMLSCPSSPSQNNTRLVEGCFCPEGTVSYAPGFDICVDTCGTSLSHMRAPRPDPTPRRPSLVLTPGLSLLGCVGPDNVPREVGHPPWCWGGVPQTLSFGGGVGCTREPGSSRLNDESLKPWKAS